MGKLALRLNRYASNVARTSLELQRCALRNVGVGVPMSADDLDEPHHADVDALPTHVTDEAVLRAVGERDDSSEADDEAP